jgi:hypothetical protein
VSTAVVIELKPVTPTPLPLPERTDAVSNVSDIGKNTLHIIVDNTDPTFDLQPTAIKVNVNTPITTTVYDAQATNLNS